MRRSFFVVLLRLLETFLGHSEVAKWNGFRRYLMAVHEKYVCSIYVIRFTFYSALITTMIYVQKMYQCLTRCDRDNMAIIFQMTFSRANY